MIAKHIVSIVVACCLAAVSALGSSMANAAELAKHTTREARQGYNIDMPRDVYTQGARYQVGPQDQARFIRTGQDLTGVSAPPGNTRV